MVENETGKKLKCLRSDNGGEYCNREFDNYYSYHGICRHTTVPRTPQENGVSEIMNMTIMERARSTIQGMEVLGHGPRGKWVIRGL